MTDSPLVHRAPLAGTGPLQCCGEMPTDELMTHNQRAVTCPGRACEGRSAAEALDGAIRALEWFQGLAGPDTAREAEEDPLSRPEHATVGAAATLLRHYRAVAGLLDGPKDNHPSFVAVVNFADVVKKLYGPGVAQ